MWCRSVDVEGQGVQGIPEKYLLQNMGDMGAVEQERYYFFLRIAMFHGDGPLMAPQHTKPVEAAANLRWDQWVFGPPINQIPRGARMSLSLHAVISVGGAAIGTLDDDLVRAH